MASGAASTKVAILSSQRKVRVPRKRIERLVRFVARAEGAEVAEVDIAVVGRRKMAALNRRWLGRRGATDVLSFDVSDTSPVLNGRSDRRRPGLRAQLVICGPVAAERVSRGAAQGGVERELMLYVVHGLLHLLGYDDATAEGAAAMHAREEELLDTFRRGGRPTGRGPRCP